MPPVPATMIPMVMAFAPLFSARVWDHVQALLAGAILTPAQRTVTAALRVTGLASVRQFHRDHHMLNRAEWSELAVGRVLVALLVAAFAPAEPLRFGIDDTLERRRQVFHDPGKRIAAKGIDRDPVRTSHRHVGTASGLRWVCLMLLVPIPRAARTWALPVLTALAPSAQHAAERGRRHKSLTDWARQVRLVVRRWWPERAMVAVADSSDAALEFLAACRSWRAPVTVVTRLRLDAALYDPAAPAAPDRPPARQGSAAADPCRARCRSEHRVGRGHDRALVWCRRADRRGRVGHGGLVPQRPDAGAPALGADPRPQGRFATQALLCTDPTVAPAQILAWFIQRWQLEVTFAEARRHLGLETQRQWSAAAIRRTTPVLLGLFSLVTLLAQRQPPGPAGAIRQAAWYRKQDPTFADALALVRREVWRHQAFPTSPGTAEMVKVPRAVVERLTETLCYVA